MDILIFFGRDKFKKFSLSTLTAFAHVILIGLEAIDTHFRSVNYLVDRIGFKFLTQNYDCSMFILCTLHTKYEKLFEKIICRKSF